MGNPILKELQALKKACDDLLQKDKEIFSDDEFLLRMARNSCYKAFYRYAADILKKYEELEEKEAADYETFYMEEKTMRFKTFLGLLSMDLEKIGWYVSRYEHIIESGKYYLQCQKVVTKYCYTNAEPLKKIITYDLLIDELSLFRMPVKDLITNCIIELGLEDVKA